VVEPTMDVRDWLRKQLQQASPDLLRAMVQDFAEALMAAGQHPQRLSRAGLGHARRLDRARDPETCRCPWWKVEGAEVEG
jgi:hypothetical protein